MALWTIILHEAKPSAIYTRYVQSAIKSDIALTQCHICIIYLGQYRKYILNTPEPYSHIDLGPIYLCQYRKSMDKNHTAILTYVDKPI